MTSTNDVPVIALYGGGFINKGAEAMVRVVQAQLRDRLGTQGFRFGVEGTPAEQHLIDRDGSIRIHRDERSFDERWDRPWRRGALRRSADLGTQYRSAVALVNVSGYAFGGRQCAKRIHRFAAAAEVVKAQGGLVIAMPQAWGPFPTAGDRRAMARFLDLMDACYARDSHSHEELRGRSNRSGTRISACRDIAVCLEPEPRTRIDQMLAELELEGTSPLIAICPNMRVYDRTDGTGAENQYLRMLTDVGAQLSTSTGASLLLLPHEIRFDGDPIPDDRYLCRLLSDSLRDRGIEAAAPQARFTAQELKGLLGACAVVAGSRYHSLVASLSQGVPTVAIGWSHKYEGLLRDCGLEDYVFDYKTVGTDDIVSATQSLLENGEARRQQLLAIASDHKRDVSVVFDDLAQRLRAMLASPTRTGVPA